MSYLVFQRSCAFFTFTCAVSAVNGGAPDMTVTSILGQIDNLLCILFVVDGCTWEELEKWLLKAFIQIPFSRDGSLGEVYIYQNLTVSAINCSLTSEPLFAVRRSLRNHDAL